MNSTLLAGNRSSVGIAMFWSKPQQESWSSTDLPERFWTGEQPLGKAACSVSVRQKTSRSEPSPELRLRTGRWQSVAPVAGARATEGAGVLAGACAGLAGCGRRRRCRSRRCRGPQRLAGARRAAKTPLITDFPLAPSDHRVERRGAKIARPSRPCPCREVATGCDDDAVLRLGRHYRPVTVRSLLTR
jgi:hypothetical protein